MTKEAAPRAYSNTMIRAGMVAESHFAQGLDDLQCLEEMTGTNFTADLERADLERAVSMGKSLFDRLSEARASKAQHQTHDQRLEGDILAGQSV